MRTKQSFQISKLDARSYFKLPNRGLEAYLSKIARGNEEDYRTPFANGVDRSLVCDEWKAILESKKLGTYRDSLLDFENDMRAKIGPLSVQQPLSERFATILEYYELIHKPSVPLSNNAILETIHYFAKAKGITLKSKEVVACKMRLSTNSGTPYFTRRRKVVSDSVQLANMSNPYRLDKYHLAAILGWRGQEGGPSVDDVKQRTVFMFPFSINLLELMFYQPAVEAVQATKLIPAYVSNEYVDYCVTQLFATKRAEDVVVCTDFTAFDQHFNVDMQNAAKQVISGLIEQSRLSRIWLEKIYPVKYELPLIISKDQILHGKHGMGSGSGGTNFDESLAHKALQFEAALEQGQRLNRWSMAYGDDGILTFPGITAKMVANQYSKHGQEMNLSKQIESTVHCVVLRRWHHIDYQVNKIMVGVYSTYRALNRLMSQERFYDPRRWSKEMVCLRYLSIIENCKWHPMFEDFVRFCIKQDKYRLGIDLPGFFDNLDEISREAIDLIPDFLGYTATLQRGTKNLTEGNGINDWSVVRLLKSIAKESR